MLTFQEETVRQCWGELYPLAQEHHASTENYKRHEPFNPDPYRYIRYNEAGMFRLLTARDDERLVGYFGVYITESMHSQRPIATEDTFYLAPSHRGGRNALRFLGYVETYLRKFANPGEPVEVMFSCEDDNRTGIKKILQYLAYTPVITVYSKYLSTSADSAIDSPTESSHVGAV